MPSYDSNAALATRDDSPIQSGAPMMEIETRFGTLEIDPKHTIEMPQGPFGFGDHKHYTVIDIPNQPASQFRILQSLDDCAVGFLVLPVARENEWIAETDFLAACEAYCFDPETAGMLVIATVRSSAGAGVETTVNLKAPIVVDTRNGIARQVVFTKDSYGIRVPLQTGNSQA